MLKPLSALILSTGIMLMVGCTQTTVVKDNSVATMFARSLPAGDVAEGNAIVKASTTAVKIPSMQPVSTALNNAQNTVGATTPAGSTIGGIANSLSPANIENAIHSVLSQALTQQQHQQSLKGTSGPYYYGFPPFVGGAFNAPIFYGPGPVYFNIPKVSTSN